MQTVTEHLTQDFEAHPVGTGAELARLNDQLRVLADALEYWFDSKASAPELARRARNALKAVGR